MEEDSDNENYNENYNENFDSNNVVVPPPRTMHIQNNINDMINNMERDMLLKKSVKIEEHGDIVTVDADSEAVVTVDDDLETNGFTNLVTLAEING